jgi:hypothetical protein
LRKCDHREWPSYEGGVRTTSVPFVWQTSYWIGTAKGSHMANTHLTAHHLFSTLFYPFLILQFLLSKITHLPFYLFIYFWTLLAFGRKIKWWRWEDRKFEYFLVTNRMI